MVSRNMLLCGFILLLVQNLNYVEAQTFGLQQCEYQQDGKTLYSACVGEPFNVLLPGRSNYNLTVSPVDATCGLGAQKSYCLLYTPVNGEQCLTCDANNPNLRHPKEYMVDRNSQNQANLNTAWQSQSWYTYPTPLEINITLSFDKQYEIRDNFVITFQSSRPKRMNIEISKDYGSTWSVLEYYDQGCANDAAYPGVPRAVTAANPAAVICNATSSALTPYTGGTVTFGVLDSRYSMYLGLPNLANYAALYNAFNNTNLNSFLTFTDIRIRLLEPNNLGLSAGSQGTTIEKLQAYYAISNIKLVASCSCNLHGKFCQMDQTKGKTVCVCQHNTMGDNCEMCKPLYNNRPWRPGLYVPTGKSPSGTANECEKCQCYDHADSCVFDATLLRARCLNCYHNTTGNNCEKCIPTYYENTSLPLNSPNVCIPCNCEPLGVRNGNLLCDQTLGTCTCKQGVLGRKCDECVDGFYGLLLANNNPGVCKPCQCQRQGTFDLLDRCDKTSGNCTCKPNIEGAKCTVCKDGFYQYPANLLISADCLACECDPGGAKNNVCDKGNGQCNCKVGMTGRKCDQVIAGSFSPYIQYYSYEVASGTCALSTALISNSNPFTGRIFMICGQNQELVFKPITNLNTGSLKYVFELVMRYSLNGTLPWQEITLRLTTQGNSGKDVSKYAATPGQTVPAACPETNGQIQTFQLQNLTAGIGLAARTSNVTLDVRCKYEVRALIANPGQAGAAAKILIDSVVLSPDVKETAIYARAGPATQLEYQTCFFNFLQLSTRASSLVPPVCSSLMKSVGIEMEGQALDCLCNQIGTMDNLNMQCNTLGGQCSCKPGVFGRQCDICMPGYYNFTTTGCTPCNCNNLGSTMLVCDENTGQCPCKLNVAKGGENSTQLAPADLTCSYCKRDFFGLKTGNGCEPCLCKDTQSVTKQCDSDGKCSCLPSVGGLKCTECLPGYFGYSATGCTNCNCSTVGAVDHVCDVTTGQCKCKGNVVGIRCNQCNAKSFNLNAGNPEGCQTCFCYGHGTACVSAPGYTSDIISSPSVHNWTIAGEIVSMNDLTMFYNSITLTGTMYRQAPGQYLGYHQDSYGQLFTMVIYNMANVDIPLQGKRTVLVIGNGKGMYYDMGNTTIHGMRQTVSMRLHEQYWKPTVTDNTGVVTNLSAFNMNAILSNVQGIYIRTLYNGIAAEVESVRLEGAKNITNPAIQTPVSSVELCTCDAARSTAGNSCDKCAQGFKRSKGVADPYDVCVACDCTKRGETTPPICNEVTGQCLNCRNGTTGSKCESCDQNVQGADCDTCVDGFFGLSKGGCQACNCDTTGTKPSTNCKKADGQCDCQQFVNSRQCDKCIDNYHDLQITGCKKCDSCYEKVEIEVNKLREMQANLTNFVTQLEANDNNTVLGPFHQRLDATRANMTVLIAFLNQSIRVEPEIRAQITRLTGVLKSLNDILAVDIDADLTNATSNLNSTQFVIAEAESLLGKTREHVVKTQLFIQNTLNNITTEMGTLLTSIQRTETQISQVSGGALNDANRVLNQVKTIENDINLALSTAQNTVKIAQKAESQHMDTTKRIGELDTLLTSITTLQTSLTANVNGLNTDAKKLQTDTMAMLTETQQSTGVTVNAGALVQRADTTTLSANALRTRANQTFYNNQGIAATVQSAGVVADAHTAQIAQLEARSTGLVTRMDTAHTAATDGRTSEQKTFTDAIQMLDIMTNFNARVAAVEQRANTSLNRVQQLRTSSQAVENEAKKLQTDLQTTQQLAKDALDLSTASLQSIQKEDGLIRPVQSKAMDIQTYTDPLLNNVAQTAQEVTNLNITHVIPADKTCEGLESQLVAVNREADEAVALAATATQGVTATQTKLDKLISDILNIKQLDPARIEQLRQEVISTRTRFTSMQLGTMVSALKTASAAQRQQITAKTAKRDELRNKVRRLKNIADQFNLPGG